MIVVVHEPLLYLRILPESIELRPYKVFLYHTILLMQSISFRRNFLKEILLLVRIKKGHHCIQPGQDSNIQALMIQLLLIIGLRQGNPSRKDRPSRMDDTDEGEDIEDLEVLNLIKLGTEDLEGEELAEEDIAEFVVYYHRDEIGEVVEAFVEFGVG